MMWIDQGKIMVLVLGSNGEADWVEQALNEPGGQRYMIRSVAQLDQVLAHLDQGNVDALLFEIDAPAATAIDAIRRVSANYPGVPIVVVGQSRDESLALGVVQAGAQDYLVKGGDAERLLSRSLRYAIERKQVEERLTYLAQFDHLTGLANRSLLLDRLNQAINWGDRNNTMAAVLFLDLDHFKDVNDSLGHSAGDMLLKAVAGRLVDSVRKCDTVARLGGDEFVILTEDIRRPQDAAVVAQKIVDSLIPPFDINGNEVYVTTSLGISVFPLDGADCETLLKNADVAMYQAKKRGRNTYQFFIAEMNEHALEYLTLRNSIYRGLERGEFILNYQPQISLESGEIIGLEALLVWNHPDRGVVSPGDLSAMVEMANINYPIDSWILRTACEQIRAWRSEGLDKLRISVNISTKHFSRLDLVNLVIRVLEDTETDARSLSLEMKETVLMENMEARRAALAILRDLGVRISVDDFGTGYSSLSWLKRMPPDALKIAQSFVAEISLSSEGTMITEAIIALGHSLRLRVIAEGVETQSQLAFLAARGCDEVQGNLFCPPLQAEAVADFVRSWKPLRV
jgi:diguanylate cyclase (GGDEF)-like protein